MPRQSSISTHHDSAGDYEVELFDHAAPKRVIVCSHGNGVRRWDGEKFFYAVAEHFADSAVLLVDQNQPYGDGVQLNPLPILVSRVSEAIAQAKQRYPGAPIVVIGHSMGCPVAGRANLDGVSAVVFVAPAEGEPRQSLINRYGPDIVHGQTVTTSDGLKKGVTLEYVKSVAGIVWEDDYRKLAARFQPVYVFEAGDDEILPGPEHFTHREIFPHYEVIQGAKHNFTGAPLAALFAKLDTLL